MDTWEIGEKNTFPAGHQDRLGVSHGYLSETTAARVAGLLLWCGAVGAAHGARLLKQTDGDGDAICLSEFIQASS